HLRDVGVLERLALHDVAPVTRAIANREEDELVLFLRALERLRPPRVPVDRVVRVLKQVRAALLRESVRFRLGLLFLFRIVGRRGPRGERRERDEKGTEKREA